MNGVRPVQNISNSVNRKFNLSVTPIVGWLNDFYNSVYEGLFDTCSDVLLSEFEFFTTVSIYLDVACAVTPLEGNSFC